MEVVTFKCSAADLRAWRRARKIVDTNPTIAAKTGGTFSGFIRLCLDTMSSAISNGATKSSGVSPERKRRA